RFPTAKNSRPHLFSIDRAEIKRASDEVKKGSKHIIRYTYTLLRRKKTRCYFAELMLGLAV
ncbi:MAG: hypothetical protein RRY10_06160, partial [Christensenellaceae bacterium]